jgi:hypothetical protein
MGTRSKNFTIAFLLMNPDILVLRENSAGIWQVCGSAPWIRYCLLVFAGIGAFTLSDVWPCAFRKSTQIARNIGPGSNCEINGSVGALESADV